MEQEQKIPTASAVVSDIVEAVKHLNDNVKYSGSLKNFL
jgi:hypothetical protein